MPRRKKKPRIVEPKDEARCPERVKTDVVGDKEVVTIGPGEPMVLQGLDETGQWKDVCVVCNKGGRIKVPVNRYTKYRLESDTNKRMIVKPPVSLPVHYKTEKDKPQIMKDENDE